METLKIKARLKDNITEEKFLESTFVEIESYKGIYDIHKMKTETLEGRKNENGLYINVLRIDNDSIVFGYDESDEECNNIWVYKVIK